MASETPIEDRTIPSDYQTLPKPRSLVNAETRVAPTCMIWGIAVGLGALVLMVVIWVLQSGLGALDWGLLFK